MRRLLSLIAIGLALFSCDRPHSNESSLSVRMPDLNELVRASKSEDLSSFASGDAGTLADINCFFITVGGPDAGLNRNTCSNLTNTLTYRFGPWAGGIPRGQGAILKVPSGPDRVITLMGFKAQTGACTDFRAGGDIKSDDITNFRVLTRKKVNLEPGDQSVTLKLPSTVNTLPRINPADCDIAEATAPETGTPGPDLTPLWGDGSDGDLVINSGGSIHNVTTSGGKPLQAYGRVTNVSSDGKELTLVNTLNSFAVGDRVLFLVHAANNGYDQAASETICGGGLHPGWYDDFKVTDVTGGIITIDRPITAAPGSINNSALAENAFSRVDTFCRAQLVRQAQLKNLSINSNGAALQLHAPTYDGERGGVISFYVSENLSFGGDPAYYVNIDANRRGLAGGTSGAGIGHQGNAGVNYGLSTSGWAGTGSARSGGGGANNGAGGNGNGYITSYEAVGGTAFSPCSGTCSPAQRLLFGAGGGSGAGPFAGGTGGGIIFVSARNIVIDNPQVFITAAGGHGTSTNSSYPGEGGGGGGAGGTVLIRNDKIHRGTTATGSLNMVLKSYGGDGGAANLGAINDGNGGGGGAGAVEVRYCEDPRPKLSADNITINVQSSGGTAGNIAMGNTNNGATAGAGATGANPLGFGTGDYSIIDSDLCSQ